jgi:hypothetical protein
MPKKEAPRKKKRVRPAKTAADVAAQAVRAADDDVDLKDPSLYLNRELSLLAFQHRVL